MKRILLVIPALGPVYGGPSRIAPAMASALAQRGQFVDLVATNANGPDNLDLPTGRWLPQEGGWRLRLFPRHGRRREWKPSYPLARWLWAHVHDYSLVHHQSDFNFPALACALACRGRGVPYLINPQGMLEPWALAYKGWKKAIYYRAIERPLVLQGARALHALNQREAVNLEALRLSPPVVVIPNGIDPLEGQSNTPVDAERFYERFPVTRGRALLLFMHRVDPKKGLDVLAVAYSRVRERFPRTHVVVAGPDNVGHTPAVREFFTAAGCGGPDAVTFTGMLEGDLKRGALAAADLFVTPSYSEGFSMSVLEAMAAGVPNLMTTGCNFPEAAAAGAAREVPIDAGAFATALGELLADPEAARAMGVRGREFVLNHYTWDHAAAKLQDVYRAILEGRALPHTVHELVQPTRGPAAP